MTNLPPPKKEWIKNYYLSSSLNIPPSLDCISSKLLGRYMPKYLLLLWSNVPEHRGMEIAAIMFPDHMVSIFLSLHSVLQAFFPPVYCVLWVFYFFLVTVVVSSLRALQKFSESSQFADCIMSPLQVLFFFFLILVNSDEIIKFKNINFLFVTTFFYLDLILVFCCFQTYFFIIQNIRLHLNGRNGITHCAAELWQRRMEWLPVLLNMILILRGNGPINVWQNVFMALVHLAKSKFMVKVLSDQVSYSFKSYLVTHIFPFLNISHNNSLTLTIDWICQNIIAFLL